MAGLAPSDARHVRVRDPQADFDQRFEVEDGVWGGTLEGEDPPRAPGTVEISFEGRTGTPSVAVFNGTTETGLAMAVMESLERVSYHRASNAIGDWSDHRIEQTTVYSDEPGLAERIAIYLGEKYAIERPAVRPMNGEARELSPGADAIVVAGRDLAR